MVSVTLPGRQTFHVALIDGAAFGYCVAIGYCVALLNAFGKGWFGEEAPVGAMLLNMAAFGAMTAYVLQVIALMRLRQRFPAIERPCVSPLGNAGAIAVGIIALGTPFVLFLNPGHRLGSYGCALW